MDFRELKDRVFAAGQSAGLEELEVYATRTKNLHVAVFEGAVDDYRASLEQGVGLRARWAGRIGYAYVEKLDDDSVEYLVAGAKAAAQINESADEVEFHAGSGSYPQVSCFSQELAGVSPEELVAFCLDLERAALAADKRVAKVNRVLTGYEETEVYIANTRGLEQGFASNAAYGYVSALAKQDGQVKAGSKFLVERDWSKFNAARLAGEAAAEAVSLLGASSVPSGNYRILLRSDVARQLLATFVPVFSAEAVQKGLSLLKGKLDAEIASPLVTLVDDPLLEQGVGSVPFDGEGVASRRKQVIAAGRLVTYLHNLKTARKDGVESTGNASRPSFKSPVGIAPTNFFIEPGEQGFSDLTSALGDGLVIIDVQGTHSGANPVSGDFSLGAYGYLVEGGRVVRPVEQITIAGNFFRLLESVEAVGSDLEFGSLGGRGNMGSPSLIISSLAVAGV
ncbi:MAG TPA: TldD/PmbA family protein [Firmicutes bacterium]|jgi:PmbA protein|nr:TldD/PmbA family protein [Bacillota bacterium]